MTTLAIPSFNDPRPLHPVRAMPASPLTSPTFWLASALVLPVAGVVRLVRAVTRS